MKRYFITGIDTNVGKTMASAVLTEALQADYWKPVQTGVIEGSDTNEIARLISNTKTVIHKESYTFSAPVSPHLAAAIESKTIASDKIVLPQTSNTLIIEGAGGLLVPLNKSEYVIHLAKKFDAEVILVVRNYVGCINHTLLAIDYLLKNNYPLKGIILNGNYDTLVEGAIRSYADVPVLARFADQNEITKQTVSELARTIKKELFL